MPILQATDSVTGLVGVVPNLVFINTNDTPATVTTAGYLNIAVQEGLLTVSNTDIALVNTVTAGVSTVLWLAVSVTGTPGNFQYSLVTPTNSGGAIFLGNVQAGASGTAGRLISYPAAANTAHLELFATASAANANNTLITNASLGQQTTFTIPDPGVAATSFLLTNNAATQTIATGSLALTVGSVTATAGNFIAGNAAGPNAGNFQSFPAVSGGAIDKLVVAAVTTGGNFTTTISNGAMGQSSVITIPNPGAATANFLLDAGAGNLVTDYQQMLSINEFLLAAGGGVWTLTRNAQGDWDWVHTVAADTSTLGFDITEQLRAAAGRGFELVSFDVIYSIATLDLVAHTATLTDTTYVNNVAVAAVNRATAGALATVTQAQPYLSNITVAVPAFSNPAAGAAVKQVVELTVNAGATSVYSFKGINLRFTKSIK